MSAYTQASRDVFDVFRDTTPLVEPMSIDEAFLEVGGLRRIAGTPEQIAARLRREVADRVGLPITVGVARTKYLAKVASAVAKPDGLLVVPPDEEREFLHPLPVRRLWGVGPVTADKLCARGILTIGDLARVEEAALAPVIGAASARHVHALSRLMDTRPVRSGRRRRSMGAQRALGRWTGSSKDLDDVLIGLVDRVTQRLRDGGRVGATVVLRLRFADFTRATRSHTLPHPTADTAAVLHALRLLLASAADLVAERGITSWASRWRSCRTTSGPADAPVRPPLQPPAGHRPGRRPGAVGRDAIGRTGLLGRSRGIEMPVLDDDPGGPG